MERKGEKERKKERNEGRWNDKTITEKFLSGINENSRLFDVSLPNLHSYRLNYDTGVDKGLKKAKKRLKIPALKTLRGGSGGGQMGSVHRKAPPC